MNSRMVRELIDVSDEVRAIGPPPIPQLDPPASMRVADPHRDAGMLSEWMNRPHLSMTWGYDRTPAQWRVHLEVQLAGTFSRPCVALLRGREYAYFEIFRAAKDVIATVYDAHPHDVGIHAAIADPAELDRGMARDVGPLILRSVFAEDPHCRRIVFDVEDHNLRTRAVMERLGCDFVGDFDLTGGRHIGLYAFTRSPDHIPRPSAPPSP